MKNLLLSALLLTCITICNAQAPAGSNQQIQFNNNRNFGASPYLRQDGTNLLFLDLGTTSSKLYFKSEDTDSGSIFSENWEGSKSRLVFLAGDDGDSDYSVFRNKHWIVGDKDVFEIHRTQTMANSNFYVMNGNLGISTTKPAKKLHVNGGIGIMNGTYSEGFKIDYVDGGSGTTTFMSNRWGGNIYFKRCSALGERTQFFFGGANEHYMSIYNSNNEVKIKFNSGGDSFINGGDVGIGTEETYGFKLGVKGKIAAEEVKVAIYPWSDFVFESDYNLPTLTEVEQHIKEKGHLKDIPSAKEVSENGIFLGEMNSKLLQKIEELTLYTIQQEKKITEQNTHLEALTLHNNQQEKRIKRLENENNDYKSQNNRIKWLEEQIALLLSAKQ